MDYDESRDPYMSEFANEEPTPRVERLFADWWRQLTPGSRYCWGAFALQFVEQRQGVSAEVATPALDEANRNPMREWPIVTDQVRRIFAPAEDRVVARDDPILGSYPPPVAPAVTSAQIAWNQHYGGLTNHAIKAARQCWLVQDRSEPKLVLTYDLDTARRLRLQPVPRSSSNSRRKGDR